MYEYKCTQLGLTVNTKVLHNLVQKKCDLSGCSLGHKGSQAVSYALLGNLDLSELDMSENQIDSKVCLLVSRTVDYLFCVVIDFLYETL